MNNRVVVVSAASDPNGGMLPLLRQQMENAGIRYDVDSAGAWFATMGQAVTRFRNLVDRYHDYERIVHVDAFDNLFYGTADELCDKLPELVFGAERNCFPDQYLADKMPGSTPFKFVNFGGAAASPAALAAWCDEMEKQPEFSRNVLNQQYMNWLRSVDSPLCPIDAKAEIFYCMQKENGELGYAERNGMVRPYNSMSQSFPSFVHFNGGYNAGPFLLGLEYARLKHAAVLTLSTQ